MARQVGPFFFTGTIYDITFYKMFDIYYARMKSSLSRKKVLTSPRFARTRMHANQLAEASQIASQLYKDVPKEKRSMPFFRSIVGKAKLLLAQGMDKEVVLKLLRNLLFPEAKLIAPKQIKEKKPKEKAYVNKKGRLVWKKLNITDPLRTSLKKTVNTLSSPFIDIPSVNCHLSAVNFLDG